MSESSGPSARADPLSLPLSLPAARGATRPRPREAPAAPGGRRARTAAKTKLPAEVDPVARVAVDVSLPHLDRLFDYLVPESLSAAAVPGSRVRVRFAGQLVDGYVVERLAESDHAGRLAFVERSVAAEVVLTPEVLRLARAVADRWAGTLADVLRLAVPPRHAQTETSALVPAPAAGRATPSAAAPSVPTEAAGDRAWAGYGAGPSLLASLRKGGSPRAVWAALPGGDWPKRIADLVVATISSGRGAIVVVPDGRDAARVDAALAAALGDGQHVVLSADLGPAERYRRFLLLSRAAVRVAVGTRAAAFAPVRDLGLVVVWDDGDDLHAEPRAPYPHARDVLALRAHLANAAAIVGGHAVTAEGARLVASGWARWVRPQRAALRASAPLVRAADDPAGGRSPAPPARLPQPAWEVAHTALRSGRPVLVQVPRAGYVPALACDRCRAPLRCANCAGPLAAASSSSSPACRWCGHLVTQAGAPGWSGWRCPECGGDRIRATVVGAARTAEELGRAFPGVPVRTSSQGRVLYRVAAEPALVICTPGAEPTAAGGYGAALLLDGWALLSRADLRAGEETVRRWLNAAALVLPAAAGGRVVVAAETALRPVQALIRWDPVAHAERELAERAQLRFPPAAAFAELTGPAGAVEELLAAVRLPASGEVLGPVPGRRPARAPAGQGLEGVAARADVRALVRATRPDAAALAAALHAAQGVRSARKLPPVRVRIDPVEIG